MLGTTAFNTSNTIRTPTGAGRTVVILIRVTMCLTIAFNYRILYNTMRCYTGLLRSTIVCYFSVREYA